MRHDNQFEERKIWLAYAVLSVPLILLLANCVRGAYYDLHTISMTALSTETSRLRSQVIRHASYLEAVPELEVDASPGQSVLNEPFFQSRWDSIVKQKNERLYAAIVDAEGNIVRHTDSSVEGKKLEPGWYDVAISEVGPDVVQVSKSLLSKDVPAFDIRVPLSVNGYFVGEYHEGLERRTFDAKVTALQSNVYKKWAWVLGLVIAIDCAVGYTLFTLARRHISVVRAVECGARGRAVQLSQIAAGLAHEIRNPLHALRINLYALRRSQTSKVQLPPEELAATIDESNREIDRLEGLMRDLISFTTSNGGQRSDVDLSNELRATLSLMNEDMRHKQIEVQAEVPPQSIAVSVDPAQLRQVLVNLLTFAQNSVGPNGRIDVSLSRCNGQAEIIIGDSGRTLSDSQRARVFEPFQASKETGSGLGLALVRSFAEGAGGKAECKAKQPAGNLFRILIPQAEVVREG